MEKQKIFYDGGIVICDFNNILYSKIEGDDKKYKRWIYWFGREGQIFLRYFPKANEFQIGDTVSVHFLELLFERGIVERSFKEDWKTDEFIIKGKKYFYNSYTIDSEGNEIEAEYPDNPTIFYDIVVGGNTMDNQGVNVVKSEFIAEKKTDKELNAYKAITFFYMLLFGSNLGASYNYLKMIYYFPQIIDQQDYDYKTKSILLFSIMPSLIGILFSIFIFFYLFNKTKYIHTSKVLLLIYFIISLLSLIVVMYN